MEIYCISTICYNTLGKRTLFKCILRKDICYKMYCIPHPPKICILKL